MDENHYIGKTCSYCKTNFQEGDDVVACPACGIPHHRDCWSENGGCSTFGCTMINNEPPAAQAGVCFNCGSPLKDEYKFCDKCGVKIPAPRSGSFCIHCGMALENEFMYCIQCGQRVNPTPVNRMPYGQPVNPQQYRQTFDPAIYRQPTDPAPYTRPINPQPYGQPAYPPRYNQPDGPLPYRQTSDMLFAAGYAPAGVKRNEEDTGDVQDLPDR